MRRWKPSRRSAAGSQHPGVRGWTDLANDSAGSPRPAALLSSRVLHAPNEAPGAGSLDTNRIAWIAWDYRVWRTYLFDGAKLIPVTRTGAATAGLELDVNSITWMGWDGENLDIFVSELPHVSEGTVAVFVGKDDSVMTAQKPIR